MLLGALPLAGPGAVLIPVFQVSLRTVLVCDHTPAGVMCRQQDWGVLGARAPVRFGPLLEADFEQREQVADPGRSPIANDYVPMLALRAADGTRYPFASPGATRDPSPVRVVVPDVDVLAAAIAHLIADPAAAAVHVDRSQRFPPALWIGGAVALVVAATIARCWTSVVWRTAWRRWRDAG